MDVCILQRSLLCCEAASPIFPGTIGGKQQEDLLLCGCNSTASANLVSVFLFLCEYRLF